MDRKGSGTAVKAGERKENMGAWLRRLGRAMKDDRGGYAMITALVIIGTVITLFIWATLTIVEQSYVAQERQFARQSELYKAQGELEAKKGELYSWVDEGLTWPEYESKLMELEEFVEEKDEHGNLKLKETYDSKHAGIYRYGEITQKTEGEQEIREFTLISLEKRETGKGQTEWIQVTADLKLVLTLDEAEIITNIDNLTYSSYSESEFTIASEGGEPS